MHKHMAKYLQVVTYRCQINFLNFFLSQLFSQFWDNRNFSTIISVSGPGQCLMATMIKATTINQSVSWWACAKNIFAPNLFWLLHLKPNPKPLSFECRLKGSFIWRNKESAEKCNLTNDTKGTWLRAPNQDAQIHLKKNNYSGGKLHDIYFH